MAVRLEARFESGCNPLASRRPGGGALGAECDENHGSPDGWPSAPLEDQIGEILGDMIREGLGGGHRDNILRALGLVWSYREAYVAMLCVRTEPKMSEHRSDMAHVMT
jgi:hypothetical protein